MIPLAERALDSALSAASRARARSSTHAPPIASSSTGGADPEALRAAADEMRRRTSEDVVTYVVNRNVNFTNARLMLGPTFKNLQVSWVEHGLALSRELLDFGVNDLGGTLMNESLSSTAGAAHGQFASPARLRTLARDAGRPPAERFTLYRIRRQYASRPRRASRRIGSTRSRTRTQPSRATPC